MVVSRVMTAQSLVGVHLCFEEEHTPTSKMEAAYFSDGLKSSYQPTRHK
jgi:hypothetical protein